MLYCFPGKGEFPTSEIPLTPEIIQQSLLRLGGKVLTIVQKLAKGDVLFLQVADSPIPTFELTLKTIEFILPRVV
jgi:hypothetical protein